MATEVKRDDEQHRYEILVDGRLAGFTEFHPDGETLVFPHTEIEDAFSGQGLAKQLIAAALDDIRSRGVKIVPQCQFVRGFIDKNPDYADLLA
jgi:predicted GNAT family acetyltransferase